jgi:hypothetical protein
VSNDNAIQLDRPGIFKVKPFDWSIQPSDKTKSVAVSIGFLILSQYEDGEWISWEDYEPHVTRGWFYIIGKDGNLNQTAVDQLVKSLDWYGDLKAIKNGPPPDVVVQVTVKPNVYHEKTTFKAEWMNPENFVPGAFGASDDEVNGLTAQFGSLLRAAASAAKPKIPAAKPAPPKKSAPPKAPPVGMGLAPAGMGLPPVDDNADVPL